MLRKFSVSNFKNFSNEIIFDLSKVKNYLFNQECLSKGIVRIAQIYGPNGSGKSNIGLAMFDLVSQLTENQSSSEDYNNYLNAESDSDRAEFSYEFQFAGQIVKYEYGKSDHKSLLYERLKINEKLVIADDKSNLSSSPLVELKGAEQLTLENLKNHNISIVKYVARNTVLIPSPENIAFLEFMRFVDGMLYFRPVRDNRYIGLPANAKSISSYIIENKKLFDFENFLHSAGISCKLDVEEIGGKNIIVFDFGKKKISFTDIASTGTTSLLLLYFWILKLEEDRKSSIVFIDEFDAFFHHKLSEFIIQRLKRMEWLQIVVSTHNTTLLANEILRPDCNFIINKNKIRPIFEITEKELREAHNIEKMYRSGALDDAE